MPLSPGFSDYVVELLADFGAVDVKRMFGGAGLYRHGVGFGILDEDVFFIKADAALGAELKSQGCKPWSYSVKKDGTVRDIAYWSLPETAADDGEEASALARRSYAIAVKAAADKPKKPAKKTKAPTPKKLATKPKGKK
jgi:DNA transformation protein and related proteins